MGIIGILLLISLKLMLIEEKISQLLKLYHYLLHMILSKNQKESSQLGNQMIYKILK